MVIKCYKPTYLGRPTHFTISKQRRRTGRDAPNRGPRELRIHRALLGLAALGVAGEARRGLVGCHVAPDGSAAVFGQ